MVFAGKRVNLIVDKATAVDPVHKTVTTENQTIQADSIVLALGSQTEYFGIQGLKELSYGFKSFAEAQALRTHVELMFEKHAQAEKSEAVVGLHMVVVGAGPNGVDLAGELAVFTQHLAKKYQIAPTLVTIDLVEAGPRVLAMLPEKVSDHVHKRLRDLGVNVLCNRDMKAQDSWTLNTADAHMGTKTVIWTAGVTTNDLVKSIPGFILGKKNRVAVDEYLQAKNFVDVYCIGDIADTPYSGLAQTALYDGSYVAQVIQRKLTGKPYKVYVPHPNAFNIGTGPCWSVMMVGSLVAYGFFPYVMRTLIDIKFFLSILSVRNVSKLYFGKKDQ
jgi:NADH dehydrogenase